MASDQNCQRGLIEFFHPHSPFLAEVPSITCEFRILELSPSLEKPSEKDFHRRRDDLFRRSGSGG